MENPRIVVLASGRGSNLTALLGARATGLLNADIVAVGSDQAKAPALERAREVSTPTFVVTPKRFPDRDSWDTALLEEIRRYRPTVIVLAGFMRIVGLPLIRAFPERIINVHPSLLPSFPGLDGPGQAIAAGVRLSGCTVHLVDEGVDTGQILGQAAVPVHPRDTRQTLHERIQHQEHRLLPLVVEHFVRGDLTGACDHSPSEAALGVPACR